MLSVLNIFSICSHESGQFIAPSGSTKSFILGVLSIFCLIMLLIAVRFLGLGKNNEITAIEWIHEGVVAVLCSNLVGTMINAMHIPTSTRYFIVFSRKSRAIETEIL